MKKTVSLLQPSDWILPKGYRSTFDKHWSDAFLADKKRASRKRVTVKLTKRMSSELHRRLETGLFGKTIEEVAERMLCDTIWKESK